MVKLVEKSLDLIVFCNKGFFENFEKQLKAILKAAAYIKVSKVVFFNYDRELLDSERSYCISYLHEYSFRLYDFWSVHNSALYFLKYYLIQNKKSVYIHSFEGGRDEDFNFKDVGEGIYEVDLKKDLSIDEFFSSVGKNKKLDKYEVSKSLSSMTRSELKNKYIDISTLIHYDHATGIQRVVKEIIKRLTATDEYKLVYSFEGHDHFYLASEAKKKQPLGTDLQTLERSIVDLNDGDKLVFLDLHLANGFSKYEKIKKLQNIGVGCFFVVYDLLPIEFENFFVPELVEGFRKWLFVVAQSNGAICISKDVELKLNKWIKKNESNPYPHFKTSYFHLGADFKLSKPQSTTPDKFTTLSDLKKQNRKIFLMVGTIEPRKGHLSVLDAFEAVWESGRDYILCIVGRNGWENKEIVKRLNSKSKNLFWFERVTDNELSWVYENASCLIAASEGEGFGLPLIEAAHYDLPIVAHDIPVFREVAGKGAYFFKKGQLVVAINKWVDLESRKEHPDPSNIPYLNWEQSVEELKLILSSDE